MSSILHLLEQQCSSFAADYDYRYRYHVNFNILSYQLHNKFPLKCDTPEPCSNPELEQ